MAHGGTPRPWDAPIFAVPDLQTAWPLPPQVTPGASLPPPPAGSVPNSPHAFCAAPEFHVTTAHFSFSVPCAAERVAESPGHSRNRHEVPGRACTADAVLTPRPPCCPGSRPRLCLASGTAVGCSRANQIKYWENLHGKRKSPAHHAPCLCACEQLIGGKRGSGGAGWCMPVGARTVSWAPAASSVCSRLSTTHLPP